MTNVFTENPIDRESVSVWYVKIGKTIRYENIRIFKEYTNPL